MYCSKSTINTHTHTHVWLLYAEMHVCVCVCGQSKATLSSSLAAVRQECESLKEQLEEEQESKLELQRLISKLNSDVTHWRSRHEAESIQHSDELEEAKYMSHIYTHSHIHTHTSSYSVQMSNHMSVQAGSYTVTNKCPVKACLRL